MTIFDLPKHCSGGFKKLKRLSLDGWMVESTHRLASAGMGCNPRESVVESPKFGWLSASKNKKLCHRLVPKSLTGFWSQSSSTFHPAMMVSDDFESYDDD